MRHDEPDPPQVIDSITPRFMAKVSLSLRVPPALRERIDRESKKWGPNSRPDVEGTVTALLTEALDERDLSRANEAKHAAAAAAAERKAKPKSKAPARTKRAAGRPRRRG